MRQSALNKDELLKLLQNAIKYAKDNITHLEETNINPNLCQAFFDEIKKLRQETITTQDQIDEIKKSREINYDKSRTVWVKPKEFLYSSKKPEKAVTIPFYDIHNQLRTQVFRSVHGCKATHEEELRSQCSGSDMRGIISKHMLDSQKNGNMAAAKLLFVVSQNHHPGYDEAEKKYNGTRIYVEVDISPTSTGQMNSYNFQQEDNGHSEYSLRNLLDGKDPNNQEIIKQIVKDLRKNAKQGGAIDDQLKIYQLQLFIYSQRSCCFDCSKALYDMQNSKDNSNFLGNLQAELENDGFIFSRKKSLEVENMAEVETRPEKRARIDNKDATPLRTRLKILTTISSDFQYRGERGASEEKSDYYKLAKEAFINNPQVLQDVNVDTKIEPYNLILQTSIARSPSQQMPPKPFEIMEKEKEFVASKSEDELRPRATIFCSSHAAKSFKLSEIGITGDRSNIDFSIERYRNNIGANRSI